MIQNPLFIYFFEMYYNNESLPFYEFFAKTAFVQHL